MYNLRCEVTNSKLFFSILCLLMTIGDYFISGIEYDFFVLLILFVLSVILLIKSIIKYLVLKKNGQVIDNLPYEIIYKNNEPIMTVDYTNTAGNIIKLYKYKKDDNEGYRLYNLPEKGFTSIIINPKKEKQYYIFYPNVNLKIE